MSALNRIKLNVVFAPEFSMWTDLPFPYLICRVVQIFVLRFPIVVEL